MSLLMQLRAILLEKLYLEKTWHVFKYVADDEVHIRHLETGNEYIVTIKEKR